MPCRAAVAVVALLLAALTGCGGSSRDAEPLRAAMAPDLPARPLEGDPLRWTRQRSTADARSAAAGFAHPLYAFTPGGIEASARRTMRFRPEIDRAAAAHAVDPDVLEAMVLLESAGDPEAQASDDLDGAVGLTQILAETGRDLLGLRVDTVASARYARRIARAAIRGRTRTVKRLRSARRRVDERLDPAKALDATARYLVLARDKLGRRDLAVAAYHMGIGNLTSVLERFGAGTVPYAELFFASTPDRHAGAYALLTSFGDNSSTYLWRVDAARDILRLARDDPAELNRRAGLQTARNCAEELLHPPERTPSFGDPRALRGAMDDGDVVALPTAYLGAHGIELSPAMGSLARRVGAERSLYRGLRPPALATLAYIGARVTALSHSRAKLILTSTVRDDRYQAQLAESNVQAVDAYSLHTTGFTFDVARQYRGGRRQAQAFQAVLDRLVALNLIAYVYEPAAIHVTVASDAARLERPLGIS